MDIKISLEQLVELFGQSANDEELPLPIRRFAAQLTVLTAHVSVIRAVLGKERKARKALTEALDKQLAELATFVALIQQGAGAGGAAPQAVEPAPAETGNDDDLDDEDEAMVMAEKVLSETQAEANAIAAKAGLPAPAPEAAEEPAPAPVTPIRKPSAGKKKAATAEDAS